MLHKFLAALAFALAATVAAAANPQVELDTTAGIDQDRALPGRRAEDRRQLPRLREERRTTSAPSSTA